MASPIRILRVVSHMDRGGLETVIMNVYRAIDRRRIQFDFAVHAAESGAYDDEILRLGGRLIHVPAYRGVNHLRYQAFWSDFFKRNGEYRIVHGHVRSTARLYLGIAQRHGVVTIAHSHNASSGMGLAACAKWVLQRGLAESADLLLACSASAGKWLFGEGGRHHKPIYVVPNGLDVVSCSYNPEARERVRRAYNLGGRFVVGHVGRFHPQKNHEFLLRVFRAVRDQRPEAVLLLVGDGPRRADIERRCEGMGLGESVIFAGSSGEVPGLLQAMDVFVFPSRFEGFGNVVIEAQAAGLPCVVSDRVPAAVGVTDLVEFLPLGQSPTQWGQRLVAKVHPEVREGRVGDLVRAGYDVESGARWYEAFYSEVHRAQGSGAPLDARSIPALSALPGTAR